jgi:hypothetical protein
MTPEENKKIDELIETTNKIYQGMYGIPGTEEKGMCGKLNEVCDDHYKLKRAFYILVAFLVGSGILGGGIWAFLQ